MDAAIFCVAGLVAVWLLRSVLEQALRPGVAATADDRPRSKRRPAADDLEDETGPYPRLSARVAELEHAFKLLSNEWQDKESRVDALLKRINRLRKLEGDQVAEEPAPAVPLTREAVLARFRQQQQGG